MPAVKTTILIILDGWGIAAPSKGNPITPQTAPNYFSWLKKFPHAELEASGRAVGLFAGQEGNSEAGHLNIGAGRVVKQDAIYISDSIKDDSFFKNSAFVQAIHHLKKYRTAAHVMGLLSNHNSAHSSPEHLYALLELFRLAGVKKVYLHLFTDGRDSGQHDALTHLKKLEKHLHGVEVIASLMGRYYAMDRNKIWRRTQLAYEALTAGKGKIAASAEEAIALAYNSGESDEFISPTIIAASGKQAASIQDNDAVFFFNLRSDRARQLTKAFVQPDFEKANAGTFTRKKKPKNIRFVAMTDFGPDLPNLLTAFPSRDVHQSLVQTLCPRPQLYAAESEKFAHVTYFFNGGYAQHFCDEQWVKIPSDRIKNFAERPAMKAKEIAATVIKAIKNRRYQFIAANFANADMAGHTGNMAAARAAVAALDRELGRIITAALAAGAQAVITADHGNIEAMINPKTGEVDSEHSENPVPFFALAPPAIMQAWKIKNVGKKLPRGKLADVAPTILKMMGLKKPKEMTGHPLF